jgi:hypothetical protein
MPTCPWGRESIRKVECGRRKVEGYKGSSQEQPLRKVLWPQAGTATSLSILTMPGVARFDDVPRLTSASVLRSGKGDGHRNGVQGGLAFGTWEHFRSCLFWNVGTLQELPLLACGNTSGAASFGMWEHFRSCLFWHVGTLQELPRA